MVPFVGFTPTTTGMRLVNTLPRMLGLSTEFHRKPVIERWCPEWTHKGEREAKVKELLGCKANLNG